MNKRNVKLSYVSNPGLVQIVHSLSS